MNPSLSIGVQGVGAWSPGLSDWASWRALLRGEGGMEADAPAKPRPERLPASERRRVSGHVLAAIEVADQAVRMSGLDAADLACVFASQQGDAGIMDYMCAVLADTPEHLSPTRFHNSVHNAAVGYWTIATGCRAASNAVAAAACSFGAALLEAATQAVVEQQPILLVAHDEPGSGPLGEVVPTTQAFAGALVLSPHAEAPALTRLDLALGDANAPLSQPVHAHARALASANPCARGLPLLEALALGAPASLRLEAAPGLHLAIRVEP